MCLTLAVLVSCSSWAVPVAEQIIDERSITETIEDEIAIFIEQAMKIQFGFEVPLPREGITILATGRGGIHDISLVPGIRIQFAPDNKFVDVGVLPPFTGGWNRLILEISGANQSDILQRLNEACKNLEVSGQLTVSDIGVLVDMQLLDTKERRELGKEILATCAEAGIKASGSRDEIREVASKDVIVFIAHDPIEAFGTMDRPGALLDALQKLDLTDKFIVFFVCGIADSIWDTNFERIQDYLIYERGAAGIISFNGPIDLEVVHTLIKMLAPSSPETPFLRAFFKGLYTLGLQVENSKVILFLGEIEMKYGMGFGDKWC